MSNDAKCCRANVPELSFTRAAGEEWECPECGRLWVWEDDEAEGGGWWPSRVGTAAWRDRIGQIAVYVDGDRPREQGVITSVNDRFVFVRFGSGTTSEACPPERLTTLTGQTPGAEEAAS